MKPDRPANIPWRQWVATITRLTLDELIAQTRQEPPAWPEWVIETWCPAKKLVDPQILSIVAISGTDWPESVPHLRCPTLIVTADTAKGGIVTPAIAARVQELNAQCSVAYIPSAGHHIHFDAYDAYMHKRSGFPARRA